MPNSNKPGSPKARSTTKKVTEEPTRTRRRRSDAVDPSTVQRRTYRLGEAAAMLGISRWTLDTIIASGQLGVVTLSTGTRVILAEDLDRMLTEGYERKPRGASA